MSRSWRGVRDGTPVHGKSLCDTCRHAHIMKGEAISERRVVCEAVYMHPMIVPWKTVTECSSYVNRTMPSLHRMEKMAFILKTDKLGKPIGFMPSAEFKKDAGLDRDDELVNE